MHSYEERRDTLVSQFRQSGDQVRLAKDTSNLFRDRDASVRASLNVRSFNHVLGVDRERQLVDVEGMTPYSDLVDATLEHQQLPCVVPQLRSITIGGAISGVGIESSSFRHGLVHESIQEMEVLTGNGDVVTCTASNEHSDLYFGLPNSYGTLGYVLRLKAATITTKPFVRLEHTQHSDLQAYFDHIDSLCTAEIDFLDGSMFQPGEYYVTAATFTDEAPYTSDYAFENIYYKSIQEKEVDYLTSHDYIWRWDTDWFWCSKNVGAQNPVLRRLFGRDRLNSVFYTRIMRWNARWGLTRYYNHVRGIHTESVIQDVDIPIDRAPEFYEFFDAEIGIRPVWVCPIIARNGTTEYPLYPMQREKTYVNFGFWDVVRSKQPRPDGFYNRKVENKVDELGGIKSLYSDTFYDRQAFWKVYNRDAYDSLKRKYDRNGRLKDLYEKCVQRK